MLSSGYLVVNVISSSVEVKSSTDCISRQRRLKLISLKVHKPEEEIEEEKIGYRPWMEDIPCRR